MGRAKKITVNIHVGKDTFKVLGDIIMDMIYNREKRREDKNFQNGSGTDAAYR